jgi:hypothetical protein
MLASMTSLAYRGIPAAAGWKAGSRLARARTADHRSPQHRRGRAVRAHRRHRAGGNPRGFIVAWPPRQRRRGGAAPAARYRPAVSPRHRRTAPPHPAQGRATAPPASRAGTSSQFAIVRAAIASPRSTRSACGSRLVPGQRRPRDLQAVDMHRDPALVRPPQLARVVVGNDRGPVLQRASAGSDA